MNTSGHLSYLKPQKRCHFSCVPLYRLFVIATVVNQCRRGISIEQEMKRSPSPSLPVFGNALLI